MPGMMPPQTQGNVPVGATGLRMPSPMEGNQPIPMGGGGERPSYSY